MGELQEVGLNLMLLWAKKKSKGLQEGILQAASARRKGSPAFVVMSGINVTLPPSVLRRAFSLVQTTSSSDTLALDATECQKNKMLQMLNLIWLSYNWSCVEED